MNSDIIIKCVRDKTKTAELLRLVIATAISNLVLLSDLFSAWPQCMWLLEIKFQKFKISIKCFFFNFITCQGKGITAHWNIFLLQMASHVWFTLLQSSERQKREKWTEWCVRWSISKKLIKYGQLWRATCYTWQQIIMPTLRILLSTKKL